MKQYETCSECLIAVITGRGEQWRVDTLARTFDGKLTIFEDSRIVTFRPCGTCGADVPGIRYAAVGQTKSGEDAHD